MNIILSEDEKESCLHLFNKMKKLTHFEFFKNIFEWCIIPSSTAIKLHLFGLFYNENKKKEINPIFLYIIFVKKSKFMIEKQSIM